MKTLISVASIVCLLFVSVFVIARDKKNADMMETEGMVKAEMEKKGYQQALFAGGCFWCMEKPFEKIDGVVSVVSGYSGGSSQNPTYRTYQHGGHIEVIQITFDPQKVNYQQLLDTYWRQVDPTDAGGQFVDRGHGYTTAVFYYDESQKELAQTSKDQLEAAGIFAKSIVTPILPAKIFYAAEKYHQDYYKKNPIRYSIYRANSGRDRFLKKTWGSSKKVAPSDSDLKKRLTPIQYEVTQKDGTEPPYQNEYWDNKKPGIYVDIISNEPLFSSTDKYDSGTGWPSFTKPLVGENIVEIEDRKLFMVRTEVRSRAGNSHLGHLFNDGPEPTGLRYCINSASLRFIPAENLEKEGFKEYVHLFI